MKWFDWWFFKDILDFVPFFCCENHTPTNMFLIHHTASFLEFWIQMWNSIFIWCKTNRIFTEKFTFKFKHPTDIVWRFGNILNDLGLKEDPSNFDDVLTTDESWLHCHNLELKPQSTRWTNRGTEPTLKQETMHGK